MLTDAPPSKRNRIEFLGSDRLRTLDLPPDGLLLPHAKLIEAALPTGNTVAVKRSCMTLLGAASEFYRVPPCSIRVLAARPLQVREHSTTELFGDYHPD